MHHKIGTLLIFLLLIAANIAKSQHAFLNEKMPGDTIIELEKRPYSSNLQKMIFSNVGKITGGISAGQKIDRPLINSRITTLCTDTSERFFLRNDSISFFTNDPVKTADGNLLISGMYAIRQPVYKSGGYLIKCDYEGNVLWQKRYDSLNCVRDNFINYYRILELNDRSILLAGVTSNYNSGNNDVILTKTDNSGNIIWSKIYKSRYWIPGGTGTLDLYYVQQMKQDPLTGDVYLAGPLMFKGSSLCRLDVTTGSLIWSKCYKLGTGDRVFGIDLKQTEIRLFCTASAQSEARVAMYRINKVDGDTIQHKVFKINDPNSTKLGFVDYYPLTIRTNGNYLLAGMCIGNYALAWDGITPLYQAAVLEFDSSFNFIKAYCFRNTIAGNSNNTRVSLYPDGSGYFTLMKYISTYSSIQYNVQFKDGVILRERKKMNIGEGGANEPTAIRLSTGGDMLIRGIGDSITLKPKIEFLKLHISDSSSSCLGFTDQVTFIYPFLYEPMALNIDSVRSAVLEENPNKTITARNFTLDRLPGCFQVSNCDSLKLIPASNLICVNQSLVVIGRRNAGCGTAISWQYNTSVVNSATQTNDSTYSFQFNTPWSGFIYATLQGCNTIVDSFFISVVPAPSAVNLGPDIDLCPNNSITLNAHTGYMSYHWQNGSTDSTLIVNQPGLYYVEVTTACGSVFTDTVIVSPLASSSINIGLDRVKCNSDTIHLNAPAGFLNYYWSPNYNISALSGQQVTVNPLLDTSYFIKAEVSPGCFAFDTIHITVNSSPIINLGIDTSICLGQSIILNAGTGFNSYQWNSGLNTVTDTVNAVGSYSVIATTTQGCRSYDTLNILNVYPLPVVDLDNNRGLCSGSSRTFDAGNFSSFEWQDGSRARTFTTNQTGIYYVTVIDNKGCSGSDTTRINTVYPSPKDFLVGESEICRYKESVLSVTQPFQTYLWNTNTQSSSIKIRQPGLFWVEVTDINGCKGRDSITVKSKACLNGLYVPGVFTPNGDTKNDQLRALLFGEIRSFEFIIYNRYGQVVFITTDINTGWDGRKNGIALDPGTFVWVCKFQLLGEQMKTEYGTTVLLK